VIGYRKRVFSLGEQSHRRATLLGICLLLILGTGPVYGHHIYELGLPSPNPATPTVPTADAEIINSAG